MPPPDASPLVTRPLPDPGANRAVPVPETTPASDPPDVFALYLHIPFCASRCTYCDFYSTTGLSDRMVDYVRALGAEARWVGQGFPERASVSSVYLGGGTPSILGPGLLEAALRALREAFPVWAGAEVTLEANPGDVRPALLSAARSAGVNRLSLGMQAADQNTLDFLGRRHTHADTVRAVALARRSGLENLSVDLIFGIPGQGQARWAASIEAALALEPRHLSAYCLSVEPGTALAKWVARGVVEAPDDDAAADQYEWLEDRLARAGFAHYEISNWALGELTRDGEPAFACRHNLAYWRNAPYLGLGAGAHGFAMGLRYEVCRSVAGYMRRLPETARASSFPFPLSPGVTRHVRVDPGQAARETLFLGLRLVGEGVSQDEFVRRHGCQAWDGLASRVTRLERSGLIEWVEGSRRMRLTRRGRLLGNQVFVEFV